jgi:lipoprotein signal peptidase
MWSALESDLQDLSQIYIFLSVNSFIVLIDQLIKLSKNREFEKKDSKDIELKEEDIKLITSIGASFLTLTTEIIVLLFLKSLLVFLLISFMILSTIFLFKHSKIKKTKIFKINQAIFDIALLFKFFILYITIKFLIK